MIFMALYPVVFAPMSWYIENGGAALQVLVGGRAPPNCACACVRVRRLQVRVCQVCVCLRASAECGASARASRVSAPSSSTFAREESPRVRLVRVRATPNAARGARVASRRARVRARRRRVGRRRCVSPPPSEGAATPPRAPAPPPSRRARRPAAAARAPLRRGDERSLGRRALRLDVRRVVQAAVRFASVRDADGGAGERRRRWRAT